MNQEVTQDMTPDESAAALAFATRISEGLMPRETQEEGIGDASRTFETAPGEEIGPEMMGNPVGEEEAVEEEPEEDESVQKIDELSKSFDEFKGEMKGMIDAKLGDLTQSIKDALKE